MFYFDVDFLHSTMEPQHDLPSVASAEGEMASSFSLTEFRQPLQVQSHLEMPRILVQLGHTQRT